LTFYLKLNCFLFQSEPKHYLVHSLEAMEANPELWDYYFNDFISHALHLEDSCRFEDITQQILKAFFSKLYQEAMLERVVQLHVYNNMYHLNLAKMATVLRTLNRIQHAARPASSTLSLVDAQETQHSVGTPEHQTAFVVGHLFNALVGAAFGSAESSTSPALVTNPDKIQMWYKAYRLVLSSTCS